MASILSLSQVLPHPQDAGLQMRACFVRRHLAKSQDVKPCSVRAKEIKAVCTARSWRVTSVAQLVQPCVAFFGLAGCVLLAVE